MNPPTTAAQLIQDPAVAWVAAVWFGLAVAFLDRFDISLPRGDSIGVSGALVAAGITIVGPAPMAAVSMIAVLAAHVGRAGLHLSPRLYGAMVSRIAALTVSCTIFVLAAPRGDRLVLAVYALSAVVALAYLLTELLAAQAFLALETRRPIGRLLRGNLTRQAPLIAAQVSAAVLAYITYSGMNAWSLVLVVALLLMMRQSYALLLEMRETYRTTVEVLVEAAEGLDQRRQGHSERTAQIARAIAMRAGLNASEVERASYAALLHDIDAIAEADSAGEGAAALGHSSDVFKGAEFFSDVIPVLRLCDGTAEGEDKTDSNLLTAMIVALASDVDVAANPGVSEAHSGAAVERVARIVTPALKARAVGAALELGYEIPAVR